MSEGTPNLGEIMKTAQRLQQEVQRVQQELAREVVEGSAGGGLVTVRANGRHQVLSVAIDSTLVTAENREMLQDLVVAAVNQAFSKASELAQSALSRVAGGLPLGIDGLV